MKRIFNSLFVIFFVFAAVTTASAEIVDRIVAVVNDTIITLSELESAEKESKSTLGSGKLDRDEILSELINKRLMKQVAERYGIDVTESELDRAINDVMERNNFTEEVLRTELIKQGMSYEEYRDQLREEIRQVKFTEMVFRSQVQITDEDIENYYLQNRDALSGAPEYRISLMIISGKKEKERVALIQDMLSKGEDFASLVKEFSDGPAAENGGDMGFIKMGEIDSKIEAAALGLKKGELSEPFSISQGTAIVRLVDKREGRMVELKKVRSEIGQKLYEELSRDKYDKWLEDIRDSAHIEIRL